MPVPSLPWEQGDRGVEVVDVSPRDGLQNERVLLPTETKLELVSRLVAAGVRRVEVTSFVDPRRVPAMADAEQVMASLPRRQDVTYVGLVLNQRGVERAISAGCREVNYGVAASDGFSVRNQGTTAVSAVASWERVVEATGRAGVAPSLVVSTAFGCPYEGPVPLPHLLRTVETALEGGLPSRLTLADTIGVATPRDVVERLEAVARLVPAEVTLAAHFHNTRNTGIANAYAALEAGVRSFDASLGGIGGCPFAPDATGNVPTEDLVYMLEGMGLETGLSLAALADASRWLEGHLGESVVGLYAKAGPFPPA